MAILAYPNSAQGVWQSLQPGLQNVGNYAQAGLQGLGTVGQAGLQGLGAAGQYGLQGLGAGAQAAGQGLGTAAQYGLQGAQAAGGLGLQGVQAGLSGAGYGLQGVGAGLSALGNYGYGTPPSAAAPGQPSYPLQQPTQAANAPTGQPLPGQFQQPMQQQFPNQAPQQMGFQPQGYFPQSQNEQFEKVVEPEIDPKTGKKTGRFKSFMRRIGQGLKEVGKGAKKFALGEEGKLGTYDLYSPAQQSAFSQILQQALGNLGAQDQFSFDPIAKQAREGFAQQTIPSIAERFSSMGAQRSSAFPQLLGQAGAGLESSLAAQKAEIGLHKRDQQQRMLLSLLGLGLQPQFSSYYQQPSQGFLQSAASSLPLLGYAALAGKK